MLRLTQVQSPATVLMRPDIDTDQIIPAAFLKSTTRGDLAHGLFHGWRFDADGAPRPDFALNEAPDRGAQILVAGPNFGCGSSREHAVWALSDFGFRVVVSAGFADIFRSNALRLGLLPVEVDGTWLERLAAACLADRELQVEVDLKSQSIRYGESSAGFEVDAFSRHCMLEGIDSFDYLLSQQGVIETFASPVQEFIDTSTLLEEGGESWDQHSG